MTYRQVNRLFTFACFATAPVLGSVVSFIWHGGALWCGFEVVSGRRRFSPDRPLRVLTALMLVYVAANVVAFLANGPSAAAAVKLLPFATFLLFPFSYSVWTISDRQEVAQAAVWGSAVAACGALVLALIQHHLIGMRAEGGAGNALVFADVACLAGLVCLAGALTIERARDKAPVLMVAYAAAFLAVLYSQSRSVWGVMIGATVVVLFLCRTRLKDVLEGRMLGVLLAVLAVGILASGIVVSRMELLGEELYELAGSGDYSTSSGLRVALWEIGAKLIAGDLLIGHGVQNTAALIGEHLGADYGVGRSFSHFHNGFITAFVEGGVLSGGAVIGIFATILVIALRTLQDNEEPTARFGALILVALFCVYVVGGSVNLIFGHDILDSVFMIFLITGVYLAAGSSALAAGGSPADDAAGGQTRP
ncbi:O-antigen ligase [Nitratireductor sp. ZSWI3]|uniref:O-antigen ligase family protein n=1 Tax=Nitratireductor sp. ZSWI3 TaxID=2966359 RepID=UPI0021504ABA|nr:O-antigen ligase family protein [Nitratireductor sp. ZSWI3]MCR4268274.1 O-antigen ligase family protein [Nitratireductor sp. ZSWI3]